LLRFFYSFLAVVFISGAVTSSIYFVNKTERKEARESIIFFPIDEKAAFKEAYTLLTFLEKKDIDEYLLSWEVYSTLNQSAYLRQDISMLYKNGRLKETMSEWKENSYKMKQNKKVAGKGSRLYQAISLHYGEIHHDAGKITSTQCMSGDHLYVIYPPDRTIESFKDPETIEQQRWKKKLDDVTAQKLSNSWEKLIKYFEIPAYKYYLIPLSQLKEYNDKPLFSMNMELTRRAIGNLWEGLYKNYFLGIKLEDGLVISPIGSTMPLLLISKNYTHMIVLFETADGKPIQLIQYISP
jgi:hypothetical protein